MLRGRYLRAVCCRSSGCIVDRIPSAGNIFFVKWFSSTTLCWDASAKKEWREVFEGIFERPSVLSTKLIENQSTRSAPFMLSIFENAIHSKGARQKGFFTGRKLESFEDDGLLQVFRHLVKELNVDHAIVLCTKLPANRLKTGIDTLIRVCLEGVYEATYQQALADKIFELLKQSNYTPSKVTSQSLVNWLLDNGDALRAQKFLKLLQKQHHSNVPKALECPESTNSAEVEHMEDKMSRDPGKEFESVIGSSVLATKSQTKSAKTLSNFLDELDESQIFCDTELTTRFLCLGRLGYQEECLDNFVRLQQKGMPEGELSKLIDFYAQGLTEVFCWHSRNIKRDVEGLKRINKLLKLSTNKSFNMLIAHCANHGEIDLCIDLIQTMKSDGLEPCATSYEPLITFFAGTYEISKAEDILQIMRINGMHATKKAYECLIVAYTKSDNLEKAFNLIEEIPSEELTPDLYTPIIFAYGMKRRVSLALSVFGQMRKKQVEPSTKNFARLIHACAFRKDLKGALKVFKVFKEQEKFADEHYKLIMSAMLRVYAACGNNEQVEKMMSFTYANALVTQETKSALLKAFAERGQTQKAIEIYNQIRNGGAWPEAGAFLSLMFAMGEAGELDQLLASFDGFKKSLQTKNRVQQEELISLACSTIVHAFIRKNQLERALEFLQEIQKDNAGDVETLCLKVFTEDKCDTTSRPLTLMDKLAFLGTMRDQLNVQPTRLAYESLLESCAKDKNVECAAQVLDMMKTDNLKLNVFTYLILLRVVVSSGDLKSLNVFLSKMRRAVENSGLHDAHVKLVVSKILESANVDTSKLMCILYPSTEIFI